MCSAWVAALVSIFVRLPGRLSVIQNSCHLGAHKSALFLAVERPWLYGRLWMTPSGSIYGNGASLWRAAACPSVLQPPPLVRHSLAHGHDYGSEGDRVSH